MAKGSYRNPAASAVSKTKQSLGLQGKPGSGVLKPKASKPKSGTMSYRQAYDKAGGAAKLGDYGAWEKKAKAWNQQKYGTTEPTAKAKKMTGGSKQELAKAHSAASKPVQKKENKTGGAYAEGTTMKVNAPSETKVNQRMSQMVASAGAQESLLDGKDRRRLERKARIQDRADNRANRRQDRADNRISRIQNRADKRTSRITNKSKAKSKSSASSANQDLAMQKIDSAVKKYSAK